MREIKFRVWDNVDYMSTPFTLQDLQEKKIQFTDECMVMQYTGLKDKNGVEIYEGDIIAWDYEYDSDYDGDMPIVRRSTGKSVVKDIYDRSEIYRARQESKGCWVIGNIWKNPELLGKDEEPRGHNGGMKKGKKEN